MKNKPFSVVREFTVEDVECWAMFTIFPPVPERLANRSVFRREGLPDIEPASGGYAVLEGEVSRNDNDEGIELTDKERAQAECEVYEKYLFGAV